jgi:hypothetical protein
MCFSSPALHLVQVEESGGRDPLHPRDGQNTSVFSTPALHLVQVEENVGRDPLHPRVGHHGGRGGRPHPQEERYDLSSIITKLSLKRFVCLLQKLPPI